MLDEAGASVVAYYSLAATSAARRDLPGAMRRNSPDPVPAMLLARMAVDRPHQRAGLGQAMLMEAMKRTAAISRAAGVRMLIVHAIDDEAASFYRKYGFREMPGQTGALFLPIETIVEAM